jgi:hypothetical protein
VVDHETTMPTGGGGRMSKVYLVSSGSYDDYSVQGVFSTSEKAEEAMKLRPDMDWNCVQEMEVDSTSEFIEDNHVFKTEYRASVRMISGDVATGKPRQVYKNINDDQPCVLVIDRSGGHSDFVSVTSYESTEHAVKLAVEARQKWLRENAK